MTGLHLGLAVFAVFAVLVFVGGLGSYRAEWARIRAARRPVAVFVPEPDDAARFYDPEEFLARVNKMSAPDLSSVAIGEQQ